MPGKLEIKEISADQTWLIRQMVMWPNKPLSFVQLPDDDQGQHFGLMVDQQIISVVSLFRNGHQAQFRKFATLPTFQKRGYGSKLLEHVFSVAASQNITLVWCHARASALEFYQKMGMEPEGECFCRDGLEYVKMRKAF
ncbi:hypothetical protein TH63_08915 [Rufibacter radiotolerans]|uniref:N-acetyltransferase domain-containing protein n=1 Tax=Rufibacter radiotolerans TaxID=1379910 RepID=A0A0H4VIV5_9BACT|nr:GNAT family N-acetyltransferase [Rufibacter radiotolerans]AKQ45740.1 hypothetical protein TH63_08915 [Rufibacter radiotolerans]